MNEPPTDPPPSQEFAELVQRVLDKESSLEDVALLNRILPQDPQALRYFVKMRLLHTSLVDRLATTPAKLLSIHEAAPSQPAPTSPAHHVASGSATRHRPWLKKAALAAAAIVLLSLIGPTAYRKITSQKVYQVVATHETSEFERGSWISTRQSYQLEEGSIQFNSTDGNRLTIQAPATFSIGPKRQITLTQGKIWAELDGAPLDIHTPQGLVRDLGTTFGIDQSSPRFTRIDVLDGEIRLTSPSEESTTAGKGNALISMPGQWPPEEEEADASIYTTNLHQSIGIAFNDNTRDAKRINAEQPMDTRWTVADTTSGTATLDQSPVTVTWAASHGKPATEGLAKSAEAALFHTHLLGVQWDHNERKRAQDLGFTRHDDTGIIICIRNLDAWLEQTGATGYRIEAFRNSGVPDIRFLPISARIAENITPLETVATRPGDILSRNHPEPAENERGGRSITSFTSTFTSDTLIITVPSHDKISSVERANISAVRIIPVF